MNNDKWSYTYIIVLLISSFINILGCINILSLDEVRVNLMVIVLFNMMISLKTKNIKVKDKKTTIIGWCILLIWIITLLTAIIIQKYNVNI